MLLYIIFSRLSQVFGIVIREGMLWQGMLEIMFLAFIGGVQPIMDACVWRVVCKMTFFKILQAFYAPVLNMSLLY